MVALFFQVIVSPTLITLLLGVNEKDATRTVVVAAIRSAEGNSPEKKAESRSNLAKEEAKGINLYI